MPIWKEFYSAKSIEDALLALAGASAPAKLVAGGTDLFLDLQQGRHAPIQTLIDVTAIPELLAIETRGDDLFIGAGIPLNSIINSQLVLQNANALIEACSLIGGPQVRNVATLGGNVAHALPAGDGTIALISLNAKAEIATLSGTRVVDLQDLFLGPGNSALDPVSDLLTGFIIPLRKPSSASAFRRVMRPQGVAIAIVNFSVWIERRAEYINDIRIATGPSGPVPKRAAATENVLMGSKFGESILIDAKKTILKESKFRSSRHRATSEYRQHICGVLLEQALKSAWERSVKNLN